MAQKAEILERLFVYGTLKRGQCREHCWPCTPLSVQAALVRGKLFDTGPYPALFHGNDWVLGEVWTFRAVELPAVLKVLDEIEGYVEHSTSNLYNREKINCELLDGSDDTLLETGDQVQADVYIYAHSNEQAIFQYVAPQIAIGHRLAASWSDNPRA